MNDLHVIDLSGGILNILKRFPDRKEVRMAKLTIVWKQAVGPILSEHTSIVNLTHNGTLIVHVDDSAWRSPLEPARRFLLEKLNRSPHIRQRIENIVFRVQKKCRSCRSVPGKTTMNPEERRELDHEIERISKKIKDNKVRDAFLDAYMNWK